MIFFNLQRARFATNIIEELLGELCPTFFFNQLADNSTAVIHHSQMDGKQE